MKAIHFVFFVVPSLLPSFAFAHIRLTCNVLVLCPHKTDKGFSFEQNVGHTTFLFAVCRIYEL